MTTDGYPRSRSPKGQRSRRLIPARHVRSVLRFVAVVVAVLVALAWAYPSWSVAAGWGQGIEPALPANANPSLAAELASVSCASAGNCSAVGVYSDSADHTHALLVDESSGTWAAGVEAALPA